MRKINFIFFDFVLLFVCYLGMVDLHKNARNICDAICPGFTENISSLPGLNGIIIALKGIIYKLFNYFLVGVFSI